jgi:hypothetical protein
MDTTLGRFGLFGTTPELERQRGRDEAESLRDEDLLCDTPDGRGILRVFKDVKAQPKRLQVIDDGLILLKKAKCPPGKALSLNVLYEDESVRFSSVTGSPKALGFVLEVLKPLLGNVTEQWVVLMHSVDDKGLQFPELLMDDSKAKFVKFGSDYMFLARAAKQRKKI